MKQQLAQEDGNSLLVLPKMLRDTCHKIDILNYYCTDSSSVSPQAKEASFDIMVLVLSFLSYSVRFMRNDVAYSRSGKFSFAEFWKWANSTHVGTIANPLQPLKDQFEFLISELDGTVTHLKDLSTMPKRPSQQSDIQRLPYMLSSSSINQRPISPHPPVEDKATLPCVVYPTSRTHRFFDREQIGEQIEQYFNARGDGESFRSLALYGLGGVGKSSVALRYAEAQLRKGGLDAMFWVHSEKEVTIKQSFTDIALKLNLPNAEPKDYDQNRVLVLDWLQETSQ